MLPERFIDAAELLAEPDPGPTKYLVEDLIVDESLTAAVGKWKTTKSYAILDICIAVATGRPAFGKLAVAEAECVVFVNEESGKAALWRRLDALCRGRAIDPEELRGRLIVAPNAGVKLDDARWQNELLDLGQRCEPRLFVFDPLARMKDSQRAENEQSGMAPLIEFMRHLRDQSSATVLFVHHTGHQGTNMRGSSDLESAWETRLSWEREGQSPLVTLRSEHREAESAGPHRYRIAWDTLTRSMRFDLDEDSTEATVEQYLAEHPEASANEVYKTLGGNRKEVLATVKRLRDHEVREAIDALVEGGSSGRNHLGTTPSRASLAGGSPDPPFRGSGTTTEMPGSNGLVPPLFEAAS